MLRAALPEHGFTAHVMGYTAHAVLEALVGNVSEQPPGVLDDSVELVLPLLEVDLFGQVSE